MTATFLKPFQSRGVQPGVSSSTFRGLRAAPRILVGLFGLGVIVSNGSRAALREIPAPSFAQISPAVKAKSAPPAPPKPALDELVYRDGDRVRGRFVKREGDILIFSSERFGLLRVPVADADVTLAKPPEAPAAHPAPAAVAKEADDEEKPSVTVERFPFSPFALAAALKDFFGPWHGRFSFAAELMQDSSKHQSSTVEGRLQRKWTKDEVQLSSRLDYASVNEATSTDMIKADGSWRHDFPRKLFSVYRPTLEWNRAYFRSGVPADYVLLQQEVGAGINLVSSPTRKFRAGLSENVFDTWVTPTGDHNSQNVESVFSELEAKLPWRITLTDRGVYYYSITDNSDGWENRFEIVKKLTETLTMGLRHEIRHNNPDVRSADYRRLRVLFGFDF